MSKKNTHTHTHEKKRLLFNFYRQTDMIRVRRKKCEHRQTHTPMYAEKKTKEN